MPSKRLEEKLTIENLWIYILALLKEKEMYGYELREAIKARFGFMPGNVTAYRVLYSLKRRGLVDTKEKEVDSRKRKYYSLTTTGQEELIAGKEVLKSILSKL
jgi:PadR family transcriptional regulator PadR